MAEEVKRGRPSKRNWSEFLKAQDEAVIVQARNNAYAILLDCLRSTGSLNSEMEELMNDTAVALDIHVEMSSNHPREVFKSSHNASEGGSGSSFSSNSSTTPKRRSPRKSGTSRLEWGDCDQHNDLCEVCDKDGDLLCCDSCSLVYHVTCVRPALATVPEGDWVCAYCLRDEEIEQATQMKSVQTIQDAGTAAIELEATTTCSHRSRATDAIRTMKMLHALNINENASEMDETETLSSLLKAPFELDKSLSVYKSDSRFIVKKLVMSAGLGQSSHVELSRFWTLEEALFEVRKLSMEGNEIHNSASSAHAASKSEKVNAVDNLLKGWVMPVVSTSTAHAFKGRVPQRRKPKVPDSDKGPETAVTATDADQASDLWCKACIDDPEVVYCGFCGCRHCFGKHDNDLLVTCDYCEEKYHVYCVTPALSAVPRDAWYCQHCPVTEEGKGVGTSEKTDEKLADSDRESSELTKSTSIGGRTSKRSKAGVGYNPHSFSNSQELPNVSKYLQQDQLGASGMSSGRPPIPSSAARGRGGRRRREGRGGGGRKSVRGYRRASVTSPDANENFDTTQYPVDSRDASSWAHDQLSEGGVMGDAAYSMKGFTSALGLGKELNNLLPPVVPDHLPMKLSKVMSVIDSIPSRVLLPKEVELLSQFRTWAPEAEKREAMKMLKEKKDMMIGRLMALDPAINVQEVLARPLSEVSAALVSDSVVDVTAIADTLSDRENDAKSEVAGGDCVEPMGIDKTRD